MSNIRANYYDNAKMQSCIFLLVHVVRTMLYFLTLFFISQQAYAAIIIGNPKGDVTLSFIYDYQCVHCHHMFPVVQELISKDPDLRVKLYPVAILNNNSLFEAAIAIAATHLPGKFQELTTFLMYQPPLPDSKIQALLHKLGLNSRAFMLSAHSQWVKAQLLEGLQLLRQVHSTNIPVFIVSKSNVAAAQEVFIGEQNYKILAGVIEHARRT